MDTSEYNIKKLNKMIKCLECNTYITIDIANAMDEEGEVFKCPQCGFVFRYTER